MKNRVYGLAWFTVVAACLFPGPAALGAGTYQVDKTHSAVIFRVKHLKVSYFYGRFNDISGTYTLDAESPENSVIDITVKADSLDTNSADRDKHMKSAEFFDVEKFPEMRFKSRTVKKSGENGFRVEGDLTFHGETRPVAVDLEYVGEGKTFLGERSGFHTTLTIQRADYGMDAMLTGLGNEVQLIISIEGVKK
jgi:polyisoprenoid-binding protein YceI